MVIHWDEPAFISDIASMALLLEMFDKLKPENFVIVFNQCYSYRTKNEARKFLADCLKFLTKEAQSRFGQLTDDQIQLMPKVKCKRIENEFVTEQIRAQIVQLVNDKLPLESTMITKPIVLEKVYSNMTPSAHQ